MNRTFINKNSLHINEGKTLVKAGKLMKQMFLLIAFFLIITNVNGKTLYSQQATVTEALSTVVTTAADVVDATDDFISLREAIAYAGTNGLGSNITFDATVFATQQTITLGSTLEINKDLTIDGAGKVILDGGTSVQIMDIVSEKTITLSNLTFQNGHTLDYGGAISNNGTLTATNSTFSKNKAATYGGAIYNGGTLTATNCTFSGNSSIMGAGAVTNVYLKTFTATNCTFSGNSSSNGSGAIGNGNGSTLCLVNNLIVGNGDNQISGTITLDQYNITTGNISDIFAEVSDGKATLNADGTFHIKADGAAANSGTKLQNDNGNLQYWDKDAATWVNVGVITTLTTAQLQVDQLGVSRIGTAAGYNIYASGAYFTEAQVVTIDCVEDLQELATKTNAGGTQTFTNQLGNSVTTTDGFTGVYFVLTTDLDLSSVCGADVNGSEVNWIPIGDDTNKFKGHFNGKGHAISNLYINAPSSDYQGLFGYMKGGSIDSLHLVNTNITGQNGVGGVCGENYSGNISYCTNTGSVNGTNYVGGVCGENFSGIIINCTNICSVTGTKEVGGVCGKNGGIWNAISNCTNTGSVNGTNYVGGVCGGNTQGDINNCTNTGSVTGTKGIGGVCGSNNERIIYCTNTGSVSGTDQLVGGVCGNANRGNIDNCTNTGSVTGQSYVGGVFGNKSFTSFTNCYYDKQMCTVGGINGSDVAGQAEGKLTGEMTGLNPTGLTGFTGTNWVFAENMYPRPKGIQNTDAAIVAATPIYLYVDQTDNTNYETADSIVSNFTVGTGNDVSWTKRGTAVTVSGETVTINASGSDTLDAWRNRVIYKTVVIAIPNSATRPITIDNIDEFVAFRDSINTGTAFMFKGYNVPAGGENTYFALTDNLDLSSVCHRVDGVPSNDLSWTPIGNDTNKFKGHFNGNNRTISNLYINAPNSDD